MNDNNDSTKLFVTVGVHLAGGLLFWIVSRQFSIAVCYWLFTLIVYGAKWLGKNEESDTCKTNNKATVSTHETVHEQSEKEVKP